MPTDSKTDPRPHVLVVDQQAPAQNTTALLESQGFRTSISTSVEHATSLITNLQEKIEVALIEIDLDTEDGRLLLGQSTAKVPVILFSARHLPNDIAGGLNQGADAYLVKPGTPEVLVATIKAVLRRSAPQVRTGREPIIFDGLKIDPRSREVIVGDRVVDLTAKEFALLAFLAASPREVFSREQILAAVWGPGENNPATVTEHVRRIRVKIEENPEKPRWIVTVSGSGYRFERRSIPR